MIGVSGIDRGLRIVDAIVAVVLAPACVACDELLDSPTRGPVCARCWRSILLLTPSICDRCGDVIPFHDDGLAPPQVGSSTELLELVHGKAADAPLCFTCGTKMRPAGSCYVCEGCGSTSGCS